VVGLEGEVMMLTAKSDLWREVCGKKDGCERRVGAGAGTGGGLELIVIWLSTGNHDEISRLPHTLSLLELSARLLALPHYQLILHTLNNCGMRVAQSHCWDVVGVVLSKPHSSTSGTLVRSSTAYREEGEKKSLHTHDMVVLFSFILLRNNLDVKNEKKIP
jgi:hypothetical protein